MSNVNKIYKFEKSNPIHILILFTAVLWLLVIYLQLADFIHEFGQIIGGLLAK